jgi:hypothetical protein
MKPYSIKEIIYVVLFYLIARLLWRFLTSANLDYDFERLEQRGNFFTRLFQLFDVGEEDEPVPQVYVFYADPDNYEPDVLF